MKKFFLYLGLLKIPFDFILIILGFVSAFHFRLTEFAAKLLDPVTNTSFYADQTNFTLHYALPLALFLLLVLAYNKLYSLKNYQSVLSQAQQILVSILFWLGSIISYFFLAREFPFSRFVLLGAAIFSLVYLIIGRFIINSLQKKLLKKGFGVKKVVLILSEKKSLTKILQAINSDLRYKVVGYISDSKFNNLKLKYYGDLSKLEQTISNLKCDDLVQIGDLTGKYTNQDIVDLCRFFHKEYWFVPNVLQVQRHNITIAGINGIPLFKVNPTPLDGWGRVLKRLFDLIASAILLILLSPILLIIAILIKLDSKGPILFKYSDDGKIVYRIGQKGVPFYCYKFRTMKTNTHSQRYTVLSAQNIRKNSPLVKIKDDPRVTSLGKFLRRFDLDELPQLWNVFIGNMSLIGPRPHLIEEVNKYQKHHKFVLTVKPGISGLSQVSGRSDLDFEDEVKLDTYYIENWSLWLDLKILLKTVLVVIKGHGEFSDLS